MDVNVIRDIWGYVDPKTNREYALVGYRHIENPPSEGFFIFDVSDPANPKTTIAYQLPVDSEVKLAIFNLLGQAVRMLVDAPKAAGTHSITWNGMNDAHTQVSSGIYFVKLQAANSLRKSACCCCDKWS